MTDVDQVLHSEEQQAAPRPPRGRTKSKQSGADAAPVANEQDREIDYSLRPRSLAEFIGQQRIKQVLEMSIEAARKRGEPLDHTLFSAPPGLGKTSLAHIIARELGVNLRVTSGPAIERAGDLAAIVSDLDQGDVLFIDEIHRLARVVEEILYPAMEDFETQHRGRQRAGSAQHEALGALELLEIDAYGFDKMDRAILSAIIDKFDGGPVGVETLAAAVGEEADTIGDVYEPYLLQEGFIARTARGRIATPRAYTHLGRTRRGMLL
jgi:Holliday junction resolvasome RuvABC ATP-dependent DNA helicase subunit